MLSSIQKRIGIVLSRIPVRVVYATVGLLLIPAYILGWNVLTDQPTSYVAILSNITINFLLLFYLVGLYVDRWTKHMTRWKGWLIWAVVVACLILFFRFVGGMETRFG